VSEQIIVTDGDAIEVIEVAGDSIELIEVAGDIGPQGPQGSQGQTGPQGPQGPDGAPGSAPQAYTHDQGVPASTWTITHNLGYPPNVTILDSTGRVVEGDIAYPDANTVVLTFTASFGGKAYLS
jgi:hypothetical protein